MSDEQKFSQIGLIVFFKKTSLFILFYWFILHRWQQCVLHLVVHTGRYLMQCNALIEIKRIKSRWEFCTSWFLLLVTGQKWSVGLSSMRVSRESVNIWTTMSPDYRESAPLPATTSDAQWSWEVAKLKKPHFCDFLIGPSVFSTHPSWKAARLGAQLTEESRGQCEGTDGSRADQSLETWPGLGEDWNALEFLAFATRMCVEKA